MQPITVTALYKFVSLPDHHDMRPALLAFCMRHGLKGTLLLAAEGINGTVAGSAAAVAALHAHLKSDPRLADIEHKESCCGANPFPRMKVRLKKEIVTMGVPGIDPTRDAGIHVEPAEWNALIGDPEVVVIDTRNDYEVAIGTFAGAVNPATASFRDFPAWFRANRTRFGNRAKFAMFCTGGIRCEKATAFVRAEGFEEVFHLKGGILKYLETVPEAESRWRGECFVFDNRVSVGHGLKQGGYDLCHACRHPMSAADRASPLFAPGVSCPHCHDRLDEQRRARFAERHRQVELASARGEAHVAADIETAKVRKRERRAGSAELSPATRRSHR